jgi:hypothetical protein
MPFDTSTRQKFIKLPTQTKPTGGGTTSIDLPRSGLLNRIYVQVSVTVSGTVTTANASGIPTVLRRIRLSLNNGIDIFNVSGLGYQYLVREQIDNYADASPQASRAVVTAATFNLDFIIPIMMNNRDPIGLIMLQNEQTLATLVLDWEADSNVILTGGGTYTATAVPVLAVFEVPVRQEDWPPLNVVHSIIEDQQAIPGAGDFTYNWPRGNTYLGVYHLITPVATVYTQARLRTQQSIFLEDIAPADMRAIFNNTTNQGRDMLLAGTALTGAGNRIFWDLMGTDGLGSYGTVRDVINSAALTDLASIITASASGTLFSVRRQLIYLQPAVTAT